MRSLYFLAVTVLFAYSCTSHEPLVMKKSGSIQGYDPTEDETDGELGSWCSSNDQCLDEICYKEAGNSEGYCVDNCRGLLRKCDPGFECNRTDYGYVCLPPPPVCGNGEIEYGEFKDMLSG